jgi:hypothetical protein
MMHVGFLSFVPHHPYLFASILNTAHTDSKIQCQRFALCEHLCRKCRLPNTAFFIELTLMIGFRSNTIRQEQGRMCVPLLCTSLVV